MLVVLKGPVHVGTEIERGSAVTAALSLEHDVVISSVYVAEDRYNRDRSPLSLSVEADGAAIGRAHEFIQLAERLLTGAGH